MRVLSIEQLSVADEWRWHNDSGTDSEDCLAIAPIGSVFGLSAGTPSYGTVIHLLSME